MDLETQLSEKCRITTKDECSLHNNTSLIKFDDGTQVLRGKCTSHHGNGIYYIGTDLQSGDFYIVKEYVLPLITEQEITELLHDIQASADLKNDNLAAIKNIKHEVYNDQCIFYILQEFDFNSIYLSQLLTTKISLPVTVLKEIAQKIFTLRKYLSSNNFSYLDFTSSAIYMKENGDLKFINYGKTARLFSSDFENSDGIDIKVTNTKKSSLFRGENFSHDSKILSINVLPFTMQEFLNLCAEETLESIAGELFNQSFDVSPSEEVEEDKSEAGITLERSKSRVEDDYEIQDMIGRGGFGKVYKVLKKSDEQTYALKKIVLKPNDKELNDKMLREARILSQLNHENIVRYYTSWKENEYIEETDSESSEYMEDEIYSSTEDKCSFEMSEFEVESFCDMSYGGKRSICSRPRQTENDSKEDESILFQGETASSREINENLPTLPIWREILYIQMEFCEKKTLKSLIDSGTLLRYKPLVLKYLRQIVEGLVYIHQQNIIHRDLKPMNIFLSSNDHIKIGDFGLATNHIHYKSKNNESAVQAPPENLGSKNDSKSFTSQAGTGIYIAPELHTFAHICDQKLDMYSLGIILFEMCYKKPLTVQEWNNIVTDLRSKNVIFPEDFDNLRFSKEKVIIELLLTHDVSKRPTSKDLLNRDDLPPIVKSEDEDRQQELFRFVIDNPQLKLFKDLMEYCFKKENEVYLPVFYRNMRNFDVINKMIVEVFKLHGAQNISRSTLIPTKCCKGNCHGCIKLMNRLGGFHYMPDNNNVPFISYVALNDSIKWIKCYSLDKKIRNPLNATDESYEYNFNIITPIDFGKSLSFLPDAEILVMISKIKNLLFSSHLDSFQILISHTLLVEAIYIECNIINSTNYDEIVSPFSGNSRRTIHAAYFSANCNTEIISKLPSRINSIESAKSILQHFKIPEAQIKAKQALDELSCILRTAKKLGLKNHDVIIAPKLCKTLTLYSGLIFEFVNVTIQKSLGVGGRYDKLIKHFQDTEEIPQKRTFKYGIGMSLNMETLAEFHHNKEEIVVVSTFSQKGILNREVEILKDLWNANFACTYFKAKSKRHLKSYCRNNSVSYAIVLSLKKIKKNLTMIIDFRKKEREFEVPLDGLISAFQVLSAFDSLL